MNTEKPEKGNRSWRWIENQEEQPEIPCRRNCYSGRHPRLCCGIPDWMLCLKFPSFVCRPNNSDFIVFSLSRRFLFSVNCVRNVLYSCIFTKCQKDDIVWKHPDTVEGFLHSLCQSSADPNMPNSWIYSGLKISRH